MAIAWDTRECHEPEALNERETRQRTALIHVGACLDAGNLTRDSIREWFVRIRLWERRCNVKPDGFFDGDSTSDVLRRWMGLKINAEHRSRAGWFLALLEADGEDAENEFDVGEDAET